MLQHWFARGPIISGMPFFLRNGRLEFEDPVEGASYRCPFCDRVFAAIPAPGAPANETGREFREHLASAHPVEDHDLRTTRWREGTFVRCDPRNPRVGPLRQRKQARGKHGVEEIVPVGGGALLIRCHCGWFAVGFESELAWCELRVHYRNDYRLACPHCGWYWEDQDREDGEREMALHIGMRHPERFPWGYGEPQAPGAFV